MDTRNITGALSQHLTTDSALHPRVAIHLIVASEIAGVGNMDRSTTEEASLVNTRHEVDVLDLRRRPLIGKRANLPLDPTPDVDEQAAKPGHLGLERGVALELLHELLVERPEVDHLLLQRRGVGLLLLTVLPDGGAVPRGALLGGGVAVAGRRALKSSVSRTVSSGKSTSCWVT